MAVYGGNLYVATGNAAGAQVWGLFQQLPTAVPTITEWGMIILVILLGVGSLYYLKRRRVAI
jgi:hypothetical protein